jgi:phosphonate degradation associated HDIG domain protein
MTRTIADDIVRLFVHSGANAYFGEPVTQAAHALQCALLAERDGADDALVVAALLHDVRHLLHGLPEDIADYGADARHEDAGHEWLARYFDEAITEPVRLHVDAKRYLCAVEPSYLETLSPASLQSLALQGGAFSAAEADAFARLPHAAAAVRLRRWDDEAKIPGLETPPLSHYAARIDALARTTIAGQRRD